MESNESGFLRFRSWVFGNLIGKAALLGLSEADLHLIVVEDRVPASERELGISAKCQGQRDHGRTSS